MDTLFDMEAVCQKCGGKERVWNPRTGMWHPCPACQGDLPDPSRDTVGKFHAPKSGAPETERAAAMLAIPRTGTKRQQVLDYIASQGTRGATDEEVSLACRMRLYTAAPRRNELLNDGWIIDSGRRRVTTTGTHAAVWVLSAEGIAEYSRRSHASGHRAGTEDAGVGEGSSEERVHRGGGQADVQDPRSEDEWADHDGEGTPTL